MASSISISLKRWHIEAFTILGVLLTLGGTIDFLDARAQLPNGDVVPAYQAKQTQIVSVQQGMGPIKFACAFAGLITLAGTYYLSQLAQQQEEEQHRVMIRIQAEEEYNSDVRARFRELEAQAELEAHQQVIAPAVATAHIDRVLASDPRLVDYMEGDHAIEPSAPAQALNPQDALLAAVDKMNAQSPIQPTAQASVPTPIASVVPAPTQVSAAPIQPMQPATPAQPTQVTPVSTDLPDGAKLVSAADIANINAYPVIIVVAGKGEGKTQTVEYLLRAMDGLKIFASPKAQAKDIEKFNIVFGRNPVTGNAGFYGSPLEFAPEDSHDFWELMHNHPERRSMLDFSWGLYREIMNRQANGEEFCKERGPFRVCFDEASLTYTAGYLDPMDPKQQACKIAQNIISTSNKTGLQDGRTQLGQFFFNAQTDSVGSLGMANMADTRDSCWFLYPGLAAVAIAKKHKKNILANWLQARLDKGIAVALLEKQGFFFHAINLPTIKELEALHAGQSISQPETANVVHHPTYDLIADAQRNVA